MQALAWILRFLIVVILVWFAIKNADPVAVKGFPGQAWEAPLAFVLLVVFVAGVVIGLLAWIPTVVRQRREIARINRLSEQQAAVSAIAAREPGAERPPGSDIHGI
jgi:putative membrane protein